MRWDGNDYQLWTRFMIVCCIGAWAVDHLWPSLEVFVIGAMFLAIACAMVPRGPKPPN